jgi:hypothetical protein
MEVAMLERRRFFWSRLRLMAALTSIGLAWQIVVAQPPNDNCSNARALLPNEFATGFTTGATFDNVPPCEAPLSGPGVWFSIQGTGDMLTAETCAGADFDTRISVYSGDCSNLICVADNDNSCGLQSSAAWCSSSGEPYFILVSGNFGQTGFFALTVMDNDQPCTPPVLTIPEIYADLPHLEGQQVIVRAHNTDLETRLLVDNFGDALIRPDPNSVLRIWGPYFPPYVGPADLIEAPGTILVDPTARPGFEAVLLTSGGPPTVVATIGGPPEVPAWRHLGWPTPPPCDSCKFAMLIAGGIDSASNYPAFWKDLADFYCYKRSKGYCESNIKVFYDNGSPRDGSIPAGVVDTAESAQVQAWVNEMAHRIAACKRAGHKTDAEVVVSNHGEPDGSIDLWGFDWITPGDFRAMMQSLIDSGATNLDIELGECYGGEVLDELRDSLKTKGTNVTGSSAADSNCTANNIPEYSYWLNAKARALQRGLSLQEAIQEANHVYDSLLVRIAQYLDSAAMSLDSLHTAADSAHAQELRRIADLLRDGPGREEYFRAIACSTYCQWDTVQVKPGGRLEFSFSGENSNCGNCEVYCKNSQGRWIKKSVWNWNVPGSRGYHSGNDHRTLDAGPGETGIYAFHNNNGHFTVKVKNVTPPHGPPDPQRDTSPSNPEEFAGFSMGGRTGSSLEFGSIVANNYTTADSVGMDLTNLPQVLGPSGVQNLNVNFDIEQQNDFWQDMAAWVLVLSSNSGVITAQCTGAANSPVVLFFNGPGEYFLPLGAISGTGPHTLTLSANTDVELDCWALRTLVPTGMPAAVNNLVIQRVGNDIVLNWSAVPLADVYRIYTSSTPNGPWLPLIDVAATTYTHVNEAVSGVKRFYYVAAINQP